MHNWNQQIEDFTGNLLIAGMGKEEVAKRGYEFALALQADNQEAGDNRVTATMMAIAAQLVASALPGAYRNLDYSRRSR